PFRKYFINDTFPFNLDQIAYIAALGHNLYLPIPYQKSCKIVADPGWGQYYLINYTTFSKDTEVPTFTNTYTPEERLALRTVDRFFSTNLGKDPAGNRLGMRLIERQIELLPKENITVADIYGPAGISYISIKLPENKDIIWDDVLREITISIKWDGKTEPSVWSPLGDFFGTAPGINHYRSLPMGMTNNNLFYSYWFMPFDKNALIEIKNEGKSIIPIKVTIGIDNLKKPVEKYARFHAKWYRNLEPAPEPERAIIDWPILKTQGNGRFVGLMLHIWNALPGWWGEGDEKFFIDGEKFPSIFGTGSEDYFGYAWCHCEYFQKAFHNQTRCDTHNIGHISVNRWHISDNIPFHKSFNGYIEKYYPDDRPTQYAGVSYWYLDPNGIDTIQPTPVDQRVDYYIKKELYKEKDAFEFENLELIEKTNGSVQVQTLWAYGDSWSKGQHLWWTGAQVGDKLSFKLPVEQDGKYDVITRLTRAVDYAKIQVWLNDEKLGDEIDLYNPHVESYLVTLGNEIHLSAEEENIITIEITGINDKATKAYMVGLDFIKLTRNK
ncbi:MAG: glycoside hydrolase family 172 protein, partial [Armatimonadota bacterium]